jgi:hypothetical protein
MVTSNALVAMKIRTKASIDLTTCDTVAGGLTGKEHPKLASIARVFARHSLS